MRPILRDELSRIWNRSLANVTRRKPELQVSFYGIARKIVTSSARYHGHTRVLGEFGNHKLNYYALLLNLG